MQRPPPLNGAGVHGEDAVPLDVVQMGAHRVRKGRRVDPGGERGPSDSASDQRKTYSNMNVPIYTMREPSFSFSHNSLKEVLYIIEVPVCACVACR